MITVDDLFDELDRGWSVEGKADLASILAQVPDGENWVREELCAADLEWRWRKQSGSPSVTAGDQLPPLPSALDYEPFLPGLDMHPESIRKLLEAEWCARSVWGDGPDIDSFAESMPEIPDWKQNLSRQLYTFVPIVAVLRGSQLKHPIRFRISKDFMIGRQAADEPKAPSWVEHTGRLVIANAHFRTVSRRQLSLRLTRASEMEVRNQSSGTRVRIAESRLHPGESLRVPIPFQLTVGEIDIRVELDSQEIESIT